MVCNRQKQVRYDVRSKITSENTRVMDRQRDLRRRLVEINISDGLLQRLKKVFMDDVHSVRRLENVQSVADLVRLLERQDLLNEETLTTICNAIHFSPEAPAEPQPAGTKIFAVILIIIIIMQQPGFVHRNYAANLGL